METVGSEFTETVFIHWDLLTRANTRADVRVSQLVPEHPVLGLKHMTINKESAEDRSRTDLEIVNAAILYTLGTLL